VTCGLRLKQEIAWSKRVLPNFDTDTSLIVCIQVLTFKLNDWTDGRVGYGASEFEFPFIFGPFVDSQ
jgi:hypothetical protein